MNVTVNYGKLHKLKVAKKLNFKIPAFILVKLTEVIRNVREQAHRPNDSHHQYPANDDMLCLKILAECGSPADQADNPEG
jgi:ribosomal protein L39E